MRQRAKVGRKDAKRRHPKPTRPKLSSAAKTANQPNLSVSDLQEELERQARELDEAREERAALAEVLRLISSSPGELDPVLGTMLANAVRLCGAEFGGLYLHEGGTIRSVAVHNVPPAYAEARSRRGPFHPAPASTMAEVIRTKRTVQLADLAATQLYAERNPVTV